MKKTVAILAALLTLTSAATEARNRAFECEQDVAESTRISEAIENTTQPGINCAAKVRENSDALLETLNERAKKNVQAYGQQIQNDEDHRSESQDVLSELQAIQYALNDLRNAVEIIESSYKFQTQKYSDAASVLCRLELDVDSAVEALKNN